MQVLASEARGGAPIDDIAAAGNVRVRKYARLAGGRADVRLVGAMLFVTAAAVSMHLISDSPVPPEKSASATKLNSRAEPGLEEAAKREEPSPEIPEPRLSDVASREAGGEARPANEGWVRTPGESRVLRRFAAMARLPIEDVEQYIVSAEDVAQLKQCMVEPEKRVRRVRDRLEEVAQPLIEARDQAGVFEPAGEPAPHLPSGLAPEAHNEFLVARMGGGRQVRGFRLRLGDDPKMDQLLQERIRIEEDNRVALLSALSALRGRR